METTDARKRREENQARTRPPWSEILREAADTQHTAVLTWTETTEVLTSLRQAERAQAAADRMRTELDRCHRQELRLMARLEQAEARETALRRELRAIADQWEGRFQTWNRKTTWPKAGADLRALLDDAGAGR